MMAKFRRVSHASVDAVRVAVYQAGFILLRNAIKFPAPRYFGVLIRSGYVAPPKDTGNDVSVEVGFGTKYARRQHYEHATRRNFLKQPLDEMRTTYLSTIATLAAKALKSGRTVGAIPAAFPMAPREPSEAEMRANAKKRYARERRTRARTARAAKRQIRGES